jgi:SAM-dependent methyltransferase
LQTPAEHALVEHLAQLLPAAGQPPASVLAVGAGRSLSIEDQLTERGRSFVTDRVDVEECAVDDPRVRHAWVASVESMVPVESGAYDAAFANYVLEHVPDVRRAAAELHRVLRPGGTFVASFPNPRALEFRISNATPLAFHEWVRGKEAWPTVYDYGSIEGLVAIFREAGFSGVDMRAWSFLEGYLHRFPGGGWAGRLWDQSAQRLGTRLLLGNVYAAFRRD